MAQNGRLVIKGGYSGEKAQKIGDIQKGFLAGYSFNAVRRNLSIHSNVQYHSKWFPGMNRGMNYQNHDITMNLGPVKVGGFGTILNRKPQIYNADFSDSYQIDANKSSDYGLQIGAKVGSGNLLIKAGNTFQYQGSTLNTSEIETLDNPTVQGQKLTVNYFLNNNKTDQFISLNASRAGFDTEQGGSQKINAYSALVNGRFKSFGYTLKYELGPNYYFDYLFLARTGQSQDRRQMTVYYNSKQDKIAQNRLSLNYFEVSTSSNKSLMVRNDLDFDFPKKRWSFGIRASLNILRIKETPFLGLSFSKVLDVPIPFMKRYNNLKVRLFKDANNNDKWDKGEEAVQEANILINDKYLRSNEKRETRLRNVSKGEYQIDFSGVSNQNGWLPAKLLSDTIILKKDREILIPFKTSKAIVGKIEFSAAAYSQRGKLKLSGLRIVAVDASGKEFETITQSDGTFIFNLVEGEYTIKMPTTILGSKFKFNKTSEKVSVDGEIKKPLHFILKDKARKLNIRNSSN